MEEEIRPVIALMKALGATKDEIDQMNLYFDKYNLDKVYADTYKAMQRITIERKRTMGMSFEDEKERIINLIESKGYTYVKFGSSHEFRCKDKYDENSYFYVLIEDHHGERDVDDILIYSGYRNPSVKDWYGDNIDQHGAVEYDVMRLIISFVDILDKERRKYE